MRKSQQTLVKICGISDPDDALAAAAAGADFIGFNFYSGSPRFIEPESARSICGNLPSHVKKVGVFVDSPRAEVLEIARLAQLDYLQFHGNETPEYCEGFEIPYWKAVRMKDEDSLVYMAGFEPFAYLIDAYMKGIPGGTGELADWELAVRATGLGRIVLAGGLNPSNVGKAISMVKPWCVDTCSGIESAPGRKDHEVMKRFVENVRANV